MNILTQIEKVKSKENIDFGDNNSEMTETTLIRCRVLKVGQNCKFYKEGDVVLIKANHLNSLDYSECPKDVKITHNEDYVLCRINE